jgi:hypothetical protein
LKFTSEIQKFRTRNPAIQGMDFCVKNALKLTYELLGYQKILRGLCPLFPGNGEEGKWVGGEGRKGKERRGGRVGKGRARGKGGEARKGVEVKGKGKGREGKIRDRKEGGGAGWGGQTLSTPLF